MVLLLDTHALLWWLTDAPSLSVPARQAIKEESNEIFVSAVSAWEIATKHRIGKLPGVETLVADFEAAIEAQGFRGLPVSLRQGQIAGSLPGPHQDPFDRMLIAQAMAEQMILVSNERVFDLYGVARLW